MFADDGRDLEDVQPVIGLRVAGGDEVVRPLIGSWDGTRSSLTVGDVPLDLSDVSRLATPEQPGRLDVGDSFLVFQPYEGAELYSGKIAEVRTGDAYVVHAHQHVFPRGMARTLRFSLSLNPDRPARVARYLAPAWWYGVCEEFMPEPLLPVSSDYDAAIDSMRLWFRKYMVDGGFEDGEIPGSRGGSPTERSTPSAEGDAPGAFLMVAYRTGDAVDYDCAMRACYCFVDVFVDHAVKRVRMQDFSPPDVALPLARAHSMLGAWLETGDLFCLNTARAVVETAYWWHKNSWPRRAVGRDACFVHSAMLLYRFLGGEHWLEIARDTIRDVAAAQWPDGSFGDQGGGSGIHGHAAYIVKPWMGWMATMGIVDYLEHFPDDEEAWQPVRKFVQWLMSERAPRTKQGHKAWTYQHWFRGKELPGVARKEGPTPHLHLFHFDYTARLMSALSLRENDARYFDAFAESFEAKGPVRQSGYGEGASTCNYLPWLQAKLWNARLTENGLALAPVRFGTRTPKSATIHGPQGPIQARWESDGRVTVSPADGVDVKPRLVAEP